MDTFGFIKNGILAAASGFFVAASGFLVAAFVAATACLGFFMAWSN